jgi:tetratricopeptide (TPR) repeat protein
MKTIKSTRSLTWFLSLFTLLSLVSTQTVYDKYTTDFKKQRSHAVLEASEPLIPSATTLKAVSLGFNSAVADYIWLQTIQYFGGGSAYGQYPALGGMLNTITQVDPKFEYPYEFGLVALPFMNSADKAISLGERAQQYFPDNGLLTFYLATVYHINLKDYKKAGELYEKAAKETGAPPAAAQLAGVAFAKVSDTLSDRLVAITYWQTVYEHATSDSEKERAKNWFTHMQIVYSLELAISQYKGDHGQYPASLDALVKERYISQIPVSPINRLFDYDVSTGKVSFNRVASDN